MSVEDIAVWERFLLSPFNILTEVIYDVKVGDGIPSGENGDEDLRRDWRQLTMLRIDAVGERSGETWVIEVKVRQNLSAVGQLIAYEFLYRQAFRPVGRLKMVLVCERENPQLSGLYIERGIAVIVV